MSAPRLFILTILAFASVWLCGCGTMNVFGDKASGQPASLGGSIRIPLGGGSDAPPGGH